MDHAEGIPTCAGLSYKALKSPYNNLCEFSEKMVNLLTEEAALALQAPNHGGLDFAAYLLQDALKYDALYYRARGVPNEALFKAAQKLSKWHTTQNANR